MDRFGPGELSAAVALSSRNPVRRNLYLLGVPPQALQIVERARTIEEDVHEEVTIVQEYPFPVVVALDVERQFSPLILHLEMNLVSNGLVLAGVGPGADQEVVCEAGDLAKVQNSDVLRFLSLSRTDCRQPPRLCSFHPVNRANC